MKNLRSYNENCFDVYTQALRRKTSLGIQGRLLPLRQVISDRFTSYQQHFANNALEALAIDASYHPHRDDLQSLYGYKTATIRQVRETIDSVQPYRVSNTCQNCTINSVNSMDHVLGQAAFPELAVNPLNLFPSCTQCNGYKSASFTRHGVRRFLNLYLDILPHERYLFLEIYRENDGVLNYDFVIRNPNNIEAVKFDLILNHYTELKLFARMKKKSIDHYSELKTTITSRLQDLNMEQVTTQIIREADENLNNLGRNHYKYVMHLEMINHPEFLAEFNVPV